MTVVEKIAGDLSYLAFPSPMSAVADGDHVLGMSDVSAPFFLPSRSTERGADVSAALREMAAGRPVLVVGDDGRGGEADLVVAAESITTETMAFLVRHGSGFVHVALALDDCDRLDLPPELPASRDRSGGTRRVAVDVIDGVTTGISARDRARTARALADADTLPDAFSRPGHVVVQAARPGGVLERAGHTEAAVDLARLAGLRPAGVLCGLVSERRPTEMAYGDELLEFAAARGIPVLGVSDLADHRRRSEPRVERLATTRLPTDAGPLRVVAYRAVRGDAEHLALVPGQPIDPTFPGALPWMSAGPVHVHVECVLGDALGSRRCGCAASLQSALDRVARDGCGVVVYLRRTGGALTTCRASVETVSRRRTSGLELLDEESRAVADDILRDLGACWTGRSAPGDAHEVA